MFERQADWVQTGQRAEATLPFMPGKSWEGKVSAAAIERTMGQLDDGERAKILGLNAARVFRFPIPQRYLDQPDAAALAAEVGRASY